MQTKVEFKPLAKPTAFSYTDPIDGSVSENQGTQIALRELGIIANELGVIKSALGREEPSVVS